MIINDFDFVCVPALPDEANPPLVIDANAVLACPLPLEGFEAIARRHSHVIQILRCRKLRELPKGIALDVGGKPTRAFALPNLLSLLAAKILNHGSMV